MAEGLDLVFVLEPLDLQLLQLLHLLQLVVQSADLGGQLVHLDSVLLVLDVEVVVGLPGFRLESVCGVELRVKFESPGVSLVLLLLDDLQEGLVLLHQVGILSQQYLDLFLEFLELQELPVQEHQLLVYGHDFVLVFAGPQLPVLHLA